MVVSVVYFFLIRFVSATKLNVSMLLLSGFGVIFFQSFELVSQSTILAYAIFLITAPALGNIVVWNAIGDAFNARQGRRLFHLVSAASTLGGIASGCLIPLLIRWIGISALPVADVTSFMLMAIPVIALRQYRRAEKTQYSITNEAKRSIHTDFFYAVKNIVGSPLLKNLSIIFFLTAVATNIIDFVLKYYLQVNYDKEGIAIFYGHFNAVSNTFNLIVQLTLLSQFLTRFKTRTLFAVTPLILLLFSAPFIFIYHAIFIVALRFMDVALRFTIQDSAREIAISSLPRLLRNRSKVVFKGVMNPLGGICTGFLLNGVAPLIGPQSTPLLLIPINLITLYFVRDLNRYSASHLYNQLKTGVQENTPEIAPAALENINNINKNSSENSITYDPELLLDSAPKVREATLDSILLDNSLDLQNHSNIRKYALELIVHEARLAQAFLVLMQVLEEQDEISSPKSLNVEMQDFYDRAFYRLFKGLMALYRRDMIQTIYQSLANPKASVRAQAIELLQLTLTNCPHAKRILVLCDDYNREEKVLRLNDVEHMMPDEALCILEAESDRCFSHVVSKLSALLPGVESFHE